MIVFVVTDFIIIIHDSRTRAVAGALMVDLVKGERQFNSATPDWRDQLPAGFLVNRAGKVLAAK